MRFHHSVALLVGALLTACGQPPATTEPAAPAAATDTARYELLQLDDDCNLWSAQADSVGEWQGETFYAGLAVDRSRDSRTGRNPNDSHWGSAGRTGTLTLRAEGRPYIGNLRLKVNKDAHFRVYLDGDFIGSGRGDDWQLQDFRVGRAGRVLQIQGDAGPSANNFMVFDVRCDSGRSGGGGGYGYGFDYMGDRDDRVGFGNSPYPGSGPDRHFRFWLDLPNSVGIRGFDLYEVERATRRPTGPRWSSYNTNNWLLGVLGQNDGSLSSHRNSLGQYGTGRHAFDLYANSYNPYDDSRYTHWLDVEYSDGSRHTYER